MKVSSGCLITIPNVFVCVRLLSKWFRIALEVKLPTSQMLQHGSQESGTKKNKYVLSSTEINKIIYI